MCRYITSGYAYWRLFRYPLCTMSPNVVDLIIHLEGDQNVSIQNNASLSAFADKDHPTQLTQYFKYNADHPNDPVAKELTYVDFPQRFAWRKGCKGTYH